MSRRTSYAIYNSPGSVDRLNKNPYREVPSQFPRQIYAREPSNPSHCQPFQGSCQNFVRDPEIDYFFPTERTQHPDHFSRFGYPWCPNGYCMGNMPGKYNTPPGMLWQTAAQPENMAPERFYSEEQLSPFYVNSDAYMISMAARNAL